MCVKIFRIHQHLKHSSKCTPSSSDSKQLTAGTSTLGTVKAVAEATRAAMIVYFILIEFVSWNRVVSVLAGDGNWQASAVADTQCSSRSLMPSTKITFPPKTFLLRSLLNSMMTHLIPLSEQGNIFIAKVRR